MNLLNRSVHIVFHLNKYFIYFMGPRFPEFDCWNEYDYGHVLTQLHNYMQNSNN